MDITPRPAEHRLNAEESAELARMILVGAQTNQIALVYCRHLETGELHPLLAAVVQVSEEGFGLAPFARVLLPADSAVFASPTEEDNQHLFNPEPPRPELILPESVVNPQLILPGR